MRSSCRFSPQSWSVSIYPIFPPRILWPTMVSFRNGVPDKSNYRRYRIKTVEGQDDFASMAEVVRRRYSRVLLENRAAAPELAEFSQESVDESVTRIQHSAPERMVRLPDLINRRWRERPAQFCMQGATASWPSKYPDHRPGEGIRRGVSPRQTNAVAIAR